MPCNHSSQNGSLAACPGYYRASTQLGSPTERHLQFASRNYQFTERTRGACCPTESYLAAKPIVSHQLDLPQSESITQTVVKLACPRISSFGGGRSLLKSAIEGMPRSLAAESTWSPSPSFKSQLSSARRISLLSRQLHPRNSSSLPQSRLYSSAANMSSQPEHATLLIPGPIEFDDAVLQSMSHYRYTSPCSEFFRNAQFWLFEAI